MKGAEVAELERSEDPRPPSVRERQDSRLRAFFSGIATAPRTAGFFILFFAMIGFGALARDTGLSAGQATFLTLSVFQLPGQVALVDQIGRGATLATAAFAVILTAIRLLPMTVVLMPYLRGSGLPRWVEFAGAHFIAITAWVESLQRLPDKKPELRLPFYLGLGGTLCTMTVLATFIGFHVAGEVPGPVAAVLLFLTPVYFILSLIATAFERSDILAVGLGLALGPCFFLFVPGLDLLATGLVGGTLAYVVGRRQRERH